MSYRARKLAAAVAGVAAVAMAASVASAAPAGTMAAKKKVTIALFVAIQSNPVEQSIINNFHKVAQADEIGRASCRERV